MKSNIRHLLGLTSGLLVIVGVNAFGADYTDENLEDATGLADEVQDSESEPSLIEPLAPLSPTTWLDRGRTRSYIWIDGTKSTGSSDDQGQFPNIQLSHSGDYWVLPESFMSLDVIANYDARSEEGSLHLNQIGVRSRWSESIQSFIGKERNRRSPGLIVSPSDFIYSNTNLPGQREERRGVWLGRLSFQRIKGSIDLLLLPVQSETPEGMPQSTQNRAEVVFRGLYQLNGMDASLMFGRYLGMNRAGVSAQTLLDNKYKMYIEVGIQEEISPDSPQNRDYPVQSLLGFAYEGSETFSARIEYYENGLGLNSGDFKQMMQVRSLLPVQFSASSTQLSPFVRQKYLIANLTLPEIRKKYNLTLSTIKSLEDDSILGITRFEYIAGDHLLMGLSLTQINGGIGSQFQYRSFDNQTMVDLKYSF